MSEHRKTEPTTPSTSVQTGAENSIEPLSDRIMSKYGMIVPKTEMDPGQILEEELKVIPIGGVPELSPRGLAPEIARMIGAKLGQPRVVGSSSRSLGASKRPGTVSEHEKIIEQKLDRIIELLEALLVTRKLDNE